MTDPRQTGEPATTTTAVDSRAPSAGAPAPQAVAESTPSKPLTPEEQMALYEKDLKETDWGHQPC